MKINVAGINIRLLRNQHGWTQEDVAKRLDISIPAFSKIECGVTDVNLSRLEQIAALFGLTAAGLLANEPEELVAEPSGELNELNSRLLQRESEIMKLQGLIIQLYEELKAVTTVS